MLAHIAEGLFRPRRSVETLLARAPGVGDAALMVIAAYALQRALDILFGAPTAGLAGNVMLLLMSLAFTFFLGFLIHTVGRAFGGHATREACIVTAAWHALVMTLLWPVVRAGLGSGAEIRPEVLSPWALLAIVLYASQWVWLMARYTAAIHGFRSDWSVVGVILGLFVLLSPLVMMAVGA